MSKWHRRPAALACSIAANEAGNRPFLELEGVGNAPLAHHMYFQPKDPNRWQVRLWAKRGKLKIEDVVECEEAISIKDLIAGLGDIVDELMVEFSDAMENEITALRLEGKFGEAYKLESKPPRYGYLAYALGDQDA